MIKIIGKEFSVCTAQAELVVNPRLGLRGELLHSCLLTSLFASTHPIIRTGRTEILGLCSIYGFK